MALVRVHIVALVRVVPLDFGLGFTDHVCQTRFVRPCLSESLTRSDSLAPEKRGSRGRRKQETALQSLRRLSVLNRAWSLTMRSKACLVEQIRTNQTQPSL